ncbi:LOW QUALITY PROTEIN: hypothetical protein PFAG_04241 [Plasmodium falciparum Santa Lucia]|uniref:Uncharacterized protein n=6 Tax=Plasmodium falciparum TaxID=5833 RepID=W4IY42_PLAFP|nr:LOW QUALITY PROTEIN: hypothetical protein PFFVO_03845 [Plasmodium falciparum Vietnam Oak-Knoll (FVO)]ETW41162.1 LOW QUALITY PROTEIN: hypothetical protein PFNF135_04403 [Plasmodium falciparum NF135/5.C10]ETW54895.1 LOW QUALITY PROTEIN: hypothetical protein PFUGPA_03497 [Plasmodium falciparum Palo Alto/Uganda]ETW59747.1 LOW QUALITY PROTEIN: hypothetical protein PFMC_04209 [Plasmodium falciparum CAMP/Malaysia]EUR66693.1 LOW QUALITY PROTEIN: hypothetical protein PFBG_04273 [Plasmodium falciparum
MNAHGNCLKNYEIFCYSTFYMNKENNIREKKKFLIYFVKVSLKKLKHNKLKKILKNCLYKMNNIRNFIFSRKI